MRGVALGTGFIDQFEKRVTGRVSTWRVVDRLARPPWMAFNIITIRE
jgi:hypothetical protein